MTLDEFIESRIDDLRENSTFKIPVLEKDPKIKKKITKEFEKKFKVEIKKLPKRHVVFLNVDDYDCFDDFLKDFVKKTYNALGCDAKCADITKKDILNLDGQNSIRSAFKSFLGKVAKNGVRIVLVLKNYEEATNRLVGGYGYLRQLLDSFDLRMSAVVFTTKHMREVSKEPIGSSPFYNIFTAASSNFDVFSPPCVIKDHA